MYHLKLSTMKKPLHKFLTLSLGLLFAGSLMAQSPADNLKHSWTFKEGAADVVVGVEATLQGAAFVSGGDLILPSANSFLTLPADFIQINTYSEVAVEMWYTSVAGGNPGWSMLCYFGGSVNGLGSNGFFVTTARDDNKSRAAISCLNEVNPWTTESAVDGPEYDDGIKHHMVATISATDITFYIDGVKIGSSVLDANNKLNNVSNTNAWLGRGGYSGDPTWIGSFHEFNIYNKALTDAQVTTLFNRTNVNEVAAFKPKVFSANGTIIVSMKGFNASKSSVEVINLAGSRVALMNNVARETRLPVSKGVYMVKVQNEGNSYVQKITVK
jgi:hypothetical protein